MAITPEQYKMTQEELSGGDAGNTAYTKKIADLRALESTGTGDSNFGWQTKDGVFGFYNSKGELTKSPNAPISPTGGNINEMDDSGSPPIPNGAGDITAAGAGATVSGQSTIDALQKRIDDLAKQKPSVDVEAEKKSIWDLIKKRETTVEAQKSATELRQEALTQAYTEMGVTPEQIQKIGGLIGEITSYNQQLADIEIRKQTALDTIEGRAGIDIANLGAEQNRITKVYNSEISAKALQAGVKVQELQMLQGAYEDAKNTASQIVNLATYDQQQAVADIEWSLAAHQDMYNLLSNEEQIQWTRQSDAAQNDLDRATTEWTNKTNMVLDAAKVGIKLDINQSIEDLTEDYTARVSAAAELEGTGLTSTIVGGFEILRDATGKIVSTKSVSDGTSNKTLTNLLNEVPNYETREEALADLNKRKSSIIREVGESGFNQLKSEVDIVFPAAGTEATSKTLQEERKKLAKSSVESGNLGFIDPESGSFVFNAGGVLETEKDNGFWAGVTKLLFTK